MTPSQHAKVLEALGPGISRDDTVHGETYYTRKQVEEALRSEGVGEEDSARAFEQRMKDQGYTVTMHESGAHILSYSEPEVKP